MLVLVQLEDIVAFVIHQQQIVIDVQIKLHVLNV